MKRKLLLLCLLFVLSSSLSWSLDYSIDKESCESAIDYSTLIVQLTENLYSLEKDKKDSLKNLDNSVNENEIDLTEREELRREKNALIVEREKELTVIGRAYAISEDMRIRAEKALIESEKQRKILEKSSKQSWIIEILVGGGLFILGFILGGL